MLSYKDHSLLLECYETLDKFTREHSFRTTLAPAEMSSLIVLLDILKPELKELH